LSLWLPWRSAWKQQPGEPAALIRNDAVGLVGSKPRNRLCLWSSATPGYADLAHLLVTKSNCIAVGFWLHNTVQSSNLYSTGPASFRLIVGSRCHLNESLVDARRILALAAESILAVQRLNWREPAI
jgi:hypothetical protein